MSIALKNHIVKNRFPQIPHGGFTQAPGNNPVLQKPGVPFFRHAGLLQPCGIASSENLNGKNGKREKLQVIFCSLRRIFFYHCKNREKIFFRAIENNRTDKVSGTKDDALCSAVDRDVPHIIPGEHRVFLRYCTDPCTGPASDPSIAEPPADARLSARVVLPALWETPSLLIRNSVSSPPRYQSSKHEHDKEHQQ